jgi:YegS/Rv2252/BmrU family lipid kinase
MNRKNSILQAKHAIMGMIGPAGNPDKEWMIIVNPNAGVTKGAREWPRILRILNREEMSFQYRLTEHRDHAIHLARKSVEDGYRNLAVVGGDGTLNEVLNGIFLQQACPVTDLTLGMIPIGTGNDWCRMFGIPFDVTGAVRLLKQKKVFIQDVGKVVFHKKEETRERYFLNVAGMGYDALVAKKTNLSKERGRGGPLTYLYYVFASLFQYSFPDVEIEVDGRPEFRGELFSMNIGICRYNGGGMMQVPFAIPNDGLLDLTLIVRASKWIVIRHASKLYNGTLVNLPIVRTFRGKDIRIRSSGKIYLETDGESLGNTPLTFTVLSETLRVVVGEDMKWG